MIFAMLLMLADGASATVPAVPPAKVAKADAAADPVRCVREEVAGSLSQKRKTCHTLSEWAEIRTNAQRETDRLMHPSAPNMTN